MKISSFIFDYIRDNTTNKEIPLCTEFFNYLYSKGSIRIEEITIPSEECMEVVLDVLAKDKLGVKGINIVNSLSIKGYGYLKDRYGDRNFDYDKFLSDMKEFIKIKKYILENKEEL